VAFVAKLNRYEIALLNSMSSFDHIVHRRSVGAVPKLITNKENTMPTHCTPDLILRNGKIVTLDTAQPTAAAIAIAGERIAAVGSDAAIVALAGPGTRVIDLAGALVLPGFCDAHIHLSLWALARREVQIADASSRAEMLTRVADAAASATPGQWVVGRGWNESRWGETDFPTAADLDAVTGPDRPAILYRSDLHSAVVNSAALRLAGVDAATISPPGSVIDRDAAGRPTGFLRELAIDLVSRHIPLPAQAERLDALRGGMAELHRLGITAVHAQRIKEGTDGAREWTDLLRLRENGELRLRVKLQYRRPRPAPPGRAGAAHRLWRPPAAPGTREGLQRRQPGQPHCLDAGALRQLTPDEAENSGVSVTPPAADGRRVSRGDAGRLPDQRPRHRRPRQPRRARHLRGTGRRRSAAAAAPSHRARADTQPGGLAAAGRAEHHRQRAADPRAG
jgi:hypothetical protein